MTRAEIVREVRTWVGTVYLHQGRLKGVGVDCVGLVEGLGAFFGLPFEDRTDYNRFGHGTAQVLAEFGRWMDPLHPHLAGPGDVVGFYVRDRAVIQHVGVLTPAGMVHTHAGLGAVAEHGLDARWRERLVQAFRFRGLADP